MPLLGAFDKRMVPAEWEYVSKRLVFDSKLGTSSGKRKCCALDDVPRTLVKLKCNECSGTEEFLADNVTPDAKLSHLDRQDNRCWGRRVEAPSQRWATNSDVIRELQRKLDETSSLLKKSVTNAELLRAQMRKNEIEISMLKQELISQQSMVNNNVPRSSVLRIIREVHPDKNANTSFSPEQITQMLVSMLNSPLAHDGNVAAS